VILASQSSVANFGRIEAKGGDGFPSFVIHPSASGGGGGGGIVHLLAPTILYAPSTNVPSGTVDVSGGTGYPGSTGGGSLPTGTSFPITSGGAGGSLGGAGGQGGGWWDNLGMYGSDNGEPGYSLTTKADPTALF
jgi:hypothetical protein